MMESQMELLRMATGTQPRVCTVVRRLSSMLFKYQGQVDARYLNEKEPTE